MSEGVLWELHTGRCQSLGLGEQAGFRVKAAIDSFLVRKSLVSWKTPLPGLLPRGRFCAVSMQESTGQLPGLSQGYVWRRWHC